MIRFSKLAIVSVATSLLAFAPVAAQTTSVKGHVRKDGTYVSPHYRTAPNTTKVDNFSSKPNVNPFTGKKGTVDPYAPPKPKKY